MLLSALWEVLETQERKVEHKKKKKNKTQTIYVERLL